MQVACTKYWAIGIIGAVILIRLLLLNPQQVDKPINGHIEEYSSTDSAALIKIFYDNKEKLDPNDIGGNFEYQLEHKALNKEEHPGSLYVAIAKNNTGIIVGFITYHRYFLNTGRIYYVAVDEAFRNQGYATALLNYACKDLRKRERVNEVVINVDRKNTTAINLYRKLGFIDTNEVVANQIILKKVL